MRPELSHLLSAENAPEVSQENEDQGLLAIKRGKFPLLVPIQCDNNVRCVHGYSIRKKAPLKKVPEGLSELLVSLFSPEALSMA
jgi:hypothetical protein